jgi:hypothetical protein
MYDLGNQTDKGSFLSRCTACHGLNPTETLMNRHRTVRPSIEGNRTTQQEHLCTITRTDRVR